MQTHYEFQTYVPSNHQLHLVLPDEIPEGKVKIAITYELPQKKEHSLKSFLAKYNSTEMDIDTGIFDEHRKTIEERDIEL